MEQNNEGRKVKLTLQDASFIVLYFTRIELILPSTEMQLSFCFSKNN